MLRLAAMIWVLAGTVLAGCLVTAVLTVPAWSLAAMKLIPVAGLAGYVLGIPIAYAIAARIVAANGAHR